MNTRSRRDWSALWDFFVNEMTGLQNLYLKFLMLYDTQEGIRKTEDADRWARIQPIVISTFSGNCDRGYRVQIVTARPESSLQEYETRERSSYLRDCATAGVHWGTQPYPAVTWWAWLKRSLIQARCTILFSIANAGRLHCCSIGRE